METTFQPWQESLIQAWQQATAAAAAEFDAALDHLADVIDWTAGRTPAGSVSYTDIRDWLTVQCSQRTGLDWAVGILALGAAMLREGLHRDATTLLEEAADRWPREERKWLVARSFAFAGAGWGAYQIDAYERALHLCNRALQAALKTGSLRLEARALHHRGVTYVRLYQREAARSDLDRAHQLYEKLEYINGRARVEDSLGRLELDLGDYPAAERWFRQGLAGAQQVGNPRIQARIHGDLARLHFGRGELEPAIHHFQESLRLSEEMGDLYSVMRVENLLGEVYLSQGRMDLAQRSFERSLALAEREDHDRGKAYARYYLARAAVAQGQWQAGHELAQAARAYFEAQSMPVETALVDALEARIHAAQGEVAEAEAIYERSQQTLRRLNVPRFLSEVLIDYGFWLRQRGETSRALPLIVEAVQMSARLQAEQLVRRLRTTISEVSVEEWADALLRLQEQQTELARSYAEIRRLEEARRELTGMIIHDLKNPLTGVLLGLQTLKAVGEGDAEVRQQIIDAAISSVQTLFNMIQDILDVDRMESGQLKLNWWETDLAGVIQEAVAQLQPYAQQQQGEIDTSGVADLPPIWIDGALIRRVLVNLIGNAIRYATPGPIVISATLAEEGDAVVVSVRDEGPGIPPSDLSRIFEKYVRLERGPQASKRQGTGLGLAFCKLAVEAHGGRIWVESVPGEGSTFSFRLPIREPDLT